MSEIRDFFQLVSLGLVLLLPIANPLTSMSLLLALGKRLSYQDRMREIRRATIYVIAILCVAYYAGSWIMHSFGISVPGMRIAGGLIITFLGFTMLFPSSSVTDIPEADKTREAQRQTTQPSIAFVPLAMPGTAGPGAIAVVISLAARIHGSTDYPAWAIHTAPIAVAVLIGLLFWLCLRFSSKLFTLIGGSGVDAISRIMGFLMVCMGVQFVIDGVLAVIAEQTVA
ncbi:MarC family NAAT transporter [Kerstersia sp.]|uniref:MarC family NAAT transporter n=1 Tax=Kerstersia sp. TaxID=1930783 RepID=UPI003F8FABCC